MRLNTHLLVSLLATAALGHVALDRFDVPTCDFQAPTGKQLREFERFVELEKAMPASATQDEIVVETYFHIVAKDQTEAGGFLSNSTIEKQMQLLNDDFKGAGFSFPLKEVTFTVNPKWANLGDEMGMKKQLRKGEYGTLNLYYLGDVASKFSGFCYYPERSANKGSSTFIRDGCVQGSWTAPGGGTRFSLGRIATHEVGHWLHLLHTFDGNSCGGRGDYIDDTPDEASPASHCPEGRDTCQSPGLDPINNHMDYTDDSCRREFTPKQIARMKNAWQTYRKGK